MSSEDLEVQFDSSTGIMVAHCAICHKKVFTTRLSTAREEFDKLISGRAKAICRLCNRESIWRIVDADARS